MDYLTSRYWDNFYDSQNGRFLGNKFEELIELVLHTHFGSSWKSTKASWDNAHDFFNCSFTGEAEWAECKMYARKLTTHHIAKTLVMAINHDVNTILIFSYSPLVDNARVHLGEFGIKTGKKIQIFDDCKLERLILKVEKEKLKLYFPELPEDVIKEITPVSVTTFISNDPTVRWHQLSTVESATLPRNFGVNRRTACMYELAISSHSLEESTIGIDFSHFYTDKGVPLYPVHFINLNKILSENLKETTSARNIYFRRLEACEVVSLPLYFIPETVGRYIIPQIKVTFTANDNLHEVICEPVEINVNEYAEPPLINTKVRNFIDVVEKKISSNQRQLFDVVYGESGVGKTRILREISERLLKQNYSIYSIDGSQHYCSSFNRFITELLTQMFSLPNPQRILTDDPDLQFYSDNPKEKNVLYSILKQAVNEEQFTEQQLKSEIIPLVAANFSDRRAALIVDNIQSLDNLSADILMNLMENVCGVGQNYLLYSFNTDSLNPASRASSVLDKAQQIATKCKGDIESGYAHTYHVTPFDEDSCRQFIDNHIWVTSSSEEKNHDTAFSDLYPEIYTLIIRKIENKPLYLRQFIKATQDEGITVLEKGRFYITDINKLNERLSSFPAGSTKEIFDSRIHYLTPESLGIIVTLIYLGEINYNLYKDFFPAKIDLINELIQKDFLAIDNGTLTFIHPLAENYFIDNVALIEKEIKKTIIDQLSENRFFENRYPLSMFALKEKDLLFDKAVKEISNASAISRRNQFLAGKLLKRIFNSTPTDLPPHTYLYAIFKIFTFEAAGNRAREVENYYVLWEILIEYIPETDESMRYLFELIREYASNKASVFGEFTPCARALEEGYRKLDKIKKNGTQGISTTIIPELQARLKNREGVMYKQQMNYGLAEKNLLESLAISNEINCYHLQAMNYIDLGNIYHGDATRQECVIKYWENAVGIYKAHQEEIQKYDRDAALCCQLKESFTLAHTGQYHEAAINAGKVIEEAKEWCNTYYELQARKAKALFGFLSGEPDIPAQIIDLIRYADQYNVTKFHAFAYHLLAIYHEVQGDINAAFMQYKHILESVHIFSGSNRELCLLGRECRRFSAKYGEQYPFSSQQLRTIASLENRVREDIRSPYRMAEYYLPIP